MNERIATRLTERFGLRTPIVSAPMALVSGGALAAAVSHAGALGLIGGGYAGHLGGEPDLDGEWRKAGNAPVGIGFILWALAKAPDGGERVLRDALARRPRALFVSFPDGAGELDAPLRAARDAGVPALVQVQTLELAKAAIDCGADAIVAQGTEAGGHGGARATLPFVPEVTDLCAVRSPRTMVLGAGGIADGRGLAAALMLGADGVVVGSRFWAASEALTPDAHVDRAVGATGDDSVRTTAIDRARGLAWPAPYSFRVLDNEFAQEVMVREPAFGAEARRYDEARARGDASVVPAVAGEAAGLIAERRPAAAIVEDMTAEAIAALRRGTASIRRSP